MSRLRNFPQKVAVGMKADSELVLLPEKPDSWDVFADKSLRKVEIYSICVPATTQPKPRRRGRKSPKSTEGSQSNPSSSAPAPEPQATDPTEPQEEGAMWRCTACGKDVDNPKDANGKPQCPHCLAINKLVSKEDTA